MPSSLRNNLLACVAVAALPGIPTAKYYLVDKGAFDAEVRTQEAIKKTQARRKERWNLHVIPNHNIQNLNWARTTGKVWLEKTKLTEGFALESIKTKENEQEFSDHEDAASNDGF